METKKKKLLLEYSSMASNRINLRVGQLLLLLCVFCLLLLSLRCEAIRFIPTVHVEQTRFFSEAPDYRNGEHCPKTTTMTMVDLSPFDVCDPTDIHVAMTLDHDYLRGSIAAVHSILRHASCPNSIFFHFLASPQSTIPSLDDLVRRTFPSLKFKMYPFSSDQVSGIISSSIRSALQKPLNYARNHIADVLEPCIRRVIYLDSDVVVVDDIRKLWSTHIPAPTVIAAPEYCHANFTKYFTDAFWADPELSSVFVDRKDGVPKRQPCYFNTGVMVIDLVRWRRGSYGERIRRWMEVQKRGIPRIYELGSLPPFLLVFAGKIKAVNHRWNQHGLGGDNVSGRCRPLHPGPVSLLHWSGKGKPWARLDAGVPCPVDYLWAPYDLYLPNPSSSSSHTSL